VKRRYKNDEDRIPSIKAGWMFFNPGKSRFSLSTYWRISLSIKRHISSESRRTKPRTSIRSGLFKNILFTIMKSRIPEKGKALLTLTD
jgi:hypothetical protein